MDHGPGFEHEKPESFTGCLKDQVQRIAPKRAESRAKKSNVKNLQNAERYITTGSSSSALTF